MKVIFIKKRNPTIIITPYSDTVYTKICTAVTWCILLHSYCKTVIIDEHANGTLHYKQWAI